MTLAESLEELGKHALSPNRYLLLTSTYVSKRLPEAFCLRRTFKVIPRRFYFLLKDLYISHQEMHNNNLISLFKMLLPQWF